MYKNDLRDNMNRLVGLFMMFICMNAFVLFRFVLSMQNYLCLLNLKTLLQTLRCPVNNTPLTINIILCNNTQIDATLLRLL